MSDSHIQTKRQPDLDLRPGTLEHIASSPEAMLHLSDVVNPACDKWLSAHGIDPAAESDFHFSTNRRVGQ